MQVSSIYGHLLYQASSSIAAFLATDQPNVDVHINVSGSFLNTSFLPRQFVLISPLVAWLQNFGWARLVYTLCSKKGVAVFSTLLHYSIVTAISSVFVVKRLWFEVEHVVLTHSVDLPVIAVGSWCEECDIIDEQSNRWKLIHQLLMIRGSGTLNNDSLAGLKHVDFGCHCNNDTYSCRRHGMHQEVCTLGNCKRRLCTWAS